jgi:hypothetical protein
MGSRNEAHPKSSKLDVLKNMCPINHFQNEIVGICTKYLLYAVCFMSPHTKLLMVVSRASIMERAMGAIKGQHRFTRMVQLAEIIFAVLFPDWTVVLVLLLMGVDLIQPLFPTV